MMLEKYYMKEIRFLKVRKSQLNSDNLVVKRQIENFLQQNSKGFHSNLRKKNIFHLLSGEDCTLRKSKHFLCLNVITGSVLSSS